MCICVTLSRSSREGGGGSEEEEEEEEEDIDDYKTKLQMMRPCARTLARKLPPARLSMPARLFLPVAHTLFYVNR